MVYGLSSILGPSVGSGILDIFGQTEWQYIFFINVPICLIVLILGVAKLPQSKAEHVKPIDALGTLLLTAMTLSIMYGLKNIDFFNLAECRRKYRCMALPADLPPAPSALYTAREASS